MASGIGLRSDPSADELRRLAKASRDAKQTRRLLALASIYDGGSRRAAARIRDASGLDEILGTMQEPLGEQVVRKVLAARTQKVSDARAAGGLLLAPMVGLSTTSSPAAVPVPRNDFFGD